jgi:transposase
LLGWIRKALRAPLNPVKNVACEIQKHLWGIFNLIALTATDTASESVNAQVQPIKRTASGVRGHQRFENAILFHLRGLDLYSAAASATATTS